MLVVAILGAARMLSLFLTTVSAAHEDIETIGRCKFFTPCSSFCNRLLKRYTLFSLGLQVSAVVLVVVSAVVRSRFCLTRESLDVGRFLSLTLKGTVSTVEAAKENHQVAAVSGKCQGFGNRQV